MRVFGRSTFGGSVQLVKGRTASIEHTQINGDILYYEDTGLMNASNNTLGCNLQACKNMGCGPVQSTAPALSRPVMAEAAGAYTDWQPVPWRRRA